MFNTKKTVAVVGTLATLVAAAMADSNNGLEVLVPGGSNLWWIANSDNNVIWSCKTSSIQQFTVAISNQDTSKLAAPLPILSQQNNYDCSKTLTKQQVQLNPGTGYIVQLVNPVNLTDVYASSQPFEIKASGAYPDASATPAQPGTSSTSSSSGAGASPTSGSGSTSSNNHSAAPVGAVVSSLSALGLAVVALGSFML